MSEKSMKPGGGGRFAALKDKLQKEGKSGGMSAAIAASAGRKKYGKKKMAKFAEAGKKRAEK